MNAVNEKQNLLKMLTLYQSYNGDAFTFYKAMEAGISYGHYNLRKYFDNNKFVFCDSESVLIC